MRPICPICKTTFYAPPSRVKQGRRYCSRQCFREDYKIVPDWVRKKMSDGLKGHTTSKETRAKISFAQRNKARPYTTGNLNGVWKSDEAGYSAIHKWMTYWFGKPDVCELCGENGKKHRVEWANKDHAYKRNKEDWLKLCRMCHEKYDRKHNNQPKN